MLTRDKMAVFHKACDESDARTKAVVDRTPNSISTADLLKYLEDINVICDGMSMKVESIRCVDALGSVWHPVNIKGRGNK